MTDAVTLYGLKRCSTCMKAMAWLDQNGVPYEFIDYRDNPVAPATLADWASKVGGGEKLVNRASTTWRNLPDESKSASTEAEYLALIAHSPTLVKRPVLVSGTTGVSVGFSDKKYTELLG